MVCGKFYVTEVASCSGYSGKKITLSAVTGDPGGIPKDLLYHKYTPTGTIQMFVDISSAKSQFAVGQKFYVDFTPAE